MSASCFKITSMLFFLVNIKDMFQYQRNVSDLLICLPIRTCWPFFRSMNVKEMEQLTCPAHTPHPHALALPAVCDFTGNVERFF